MFLKNDTKLNSEQPTSLLMEMNSYDRKQRTLWRTYIIYPLFKLCFTIPALPGTAIRCFGIIKIPNPQNYDTEAYLMNCRLY